MPRSSSPNAALEFPPEKEAGFALCRFTSRWQRAVDAALKPIGMTHREYLVLGTLYRIQLATDDAVAHRTVSREAQVDEGTISRHMAAFDAKGWVDRGPDGLDARTWRVLLTTTGKAQLDRAANLIRTVTRSFAADDELRGVLRSMAGSVK